MIKKLETVDEVIAELGGFEPVRKLTRRDSSSAVPMWKVRGTFPTNTYSVLTAALHARGAVAPDALWNMAEAS